MGRPMNINYVTFSLDAFGNVVVVHLSGNVDICLLLANWKSHA